MLDIAFASLFSFFLGLIVLNTVTKRPASGAALIDSAVFLVVVTLLAAANFEFAWFAQKEASTLAFDFFSGERDGTSTFAAQAIVNAIPFLVTGAWWSAIGTNVAVLALVKVYVFERNPRLSQLMWAPGIVNFALFALRDPLIGACFLGLTLVLCIVAVGRAASLVKEGSLVVVTASLRPETVVIYTAARLYAARGALRRHPIWLLAVPVAMGGFVYLVSFVPSLLGLEERVRLSNLGATLDQFFVDRAERHAATDGGGSNILGGRLASMPVYLRFPIQVLAFFVLPLPFEIRSLALMLALADSVVFLATFRRFWRTAPSQAKVFFALYVFSVAFFASNYGNLLRLRFPAYFILIGGILAGSQTTAEAATEKPANRRAPGSWSHRRLGRIMR